MDNISRRSIYIIRAEADFERVVSLAISGVHYYDQFFIYTGDTSPFFEVGIKNKFQKKLFADYNFKVVDFCEFDFLGRILKRLTLKKEINNLEIRKNLLLFFPLIFYKILIRYLALRKYHITRHILKKINPHFVFTDQSGTDEKYLPEIFRNMSFKSSIPVFIFTHGAAGGLHSAFSEPAYEEYKNYTVFVCNKNELHPGLNNRFVLGDMSSSYPYVNFINKIDNNDLSFMNDRKHKIAFLIGGTATCLTSTNGWYKMEELIIDLSNNDDVAIMIKLHPREAKFIDFRIINSFSNVSIVENWVDRSRLVKWANIVVCSDHSSVIFEPMILGKKVIAIEGKHIPKYKDSHSPLLNSSVNFIKQPDSFNLEEIKNADTNDPITDEIAWGNNGNIDLSILFHNKVQELFNENIK